MMKRRWSNNGGFTSLRMLDESSSEVTSSSAALVMSPGMGESKKFLRVPNFLMGNKLSFLAMSPTSLGSSEYNDLELWGYDENAYTHPSVIANSNNNGGCGANLIMNGLTIGARNNENFLMSDNGNMNNANGNNNSIAHQNSVQHIVGNIISSMTNPAQTIITPLPSIIQNTINNTPRSESVNSISSGKLLKIYFFFICLCVCHIDF